MKKPIILTACLLLATIIVLAIYFQKIKENGEQLLPTIAKHLEFELNGAHYTHSKAGKKRWELTASKAQKDKGSKNIIMFQLVVNLFADDGTKTLITADKGIYNTETGNITLMNNVKITNPDYTINTDELRYLDHEEKIIISKPITIKYGKIILKADRAVMMITTKSLNFSGKVIAIITPPGKGN